MKQIILIGDLNRWEAEANFISEMLHLTATRVLSVNIGKRQAAADINARELSHLFPGKILEECVGIAVSNLYAQGIGDGILALLGEEPHLYNLADKAFAAMPFGLPKVAVLAENSTWQGSKEIMRIYLPGTTYTMNPIIKILLCNTAFAISGMCLCNIYNFGSPRPMVAALGIKADVGRYFAGAGLNYIAFSEHDQLLQPLLRNGYIHGLMMTSEIESCRQYLEIAAAKEIPIVIACKDQNALRAQLGSLPPSPGPVIVITPYYPGGKADEIQENAAPLWLRCHSVSYKFGSDGFYQYAALTLARQL